MERNTVRLPRGIRPIAWTCPRKVKALRREGPKRGARELMRIIGRPASLVNRSTVSNCPAPTVPKPRTQRITIRKNGEPGQQPAGSARALDVELRHVDIAKLDRRRKLVLVQELEQLHDVAHA